MSGTMLENDQIVEQKISHPLEEEEVGTVSMFVSRIADIHSYLFSIPQYSWSYLKPENEEINTPGTSSFRHQEYKPQKCIGRLKS